MANEELIGSIFRDYLPSSNLGVTGDRIQFDRDLRKQTEGRIDVMQYLGASIAPVSGEVIAVKEARDLIKEPAFSVKGGELVPNYDTTNRAFQIGIEAAGAIPILGMGVRGGKKLVTEGIEALSKFAARNGDEGIKALSGASDAGKRAVAQSADSLPFQKTTGVADIDSRTNRVQMMAPDEYLKQAHEESAGRFGTPFNEWMMENKRSAETVNKYADDMAKGDKFPMPYIDIAEGAQDGRNRALAAKRAGLTEIPVAIIDKPPIAQQRAALQNELIGATGYKKNRIERQLESLEAQSADLPMDEASRMARAQEMGFDTDTTWYHGTPNGSFTEFDSNKLGTTTGSKDTKYGFYFGRTRKTANAYLDEYPVINEAKYKELHGEPLSKTRSEIKALESDLVKNGVMAKEGDRIPLNYRYKEYSADTLEKIEKVKKLREKTNEYSYINSTNPRIRGVVDNVKSGHVVEANIPKNMYRHNMNGRPWDEAEQSRIAKQAKDDGFDGVIFKDMQDSGWFGGSGSDDVALVFDEAKIRSPKAKFDPAKKNSANLLAGGAAAAIGIGALTGGREEYVTKR